MFCANLISQNTTYTPNISPDLSLEHQLDIQLDIHTTWHYTLMSNKHHKQFSQNATNQPAKLIKIKSLIFTLLMCNSPSHAYFSKWCYHLPTCSSKKSKTYPRWLQWGGKYRWRNPYSCFVMKLMLKTVDTMWAWKGGQFQGYIWHKTRPGQLDWWRHQSRPEGRERTVHNWSEQ